MFHPYSPPVGVLHFWGLCSNLRATVLVFPCEHITCTVKPILTNGTVNVPPIFSLCRRATSLGDLAPTRHSPGVPCQRLICTAIPILTDGTVDVLLYIHVLTYWTVNVPPISSPSRSATVLGTFFHRATILVLPCERLTCIAIRTQCGTGQKRHSRTYEMHRYASNITVWVERFKFSLYIRSSWLKDQREKKNPEWLYVFSKIHVLFLKRFWDASPFS